MCLLQTQLNDKAPAGYAPAGALSFSWVWSRHMERGHDSASSSYAGGLTSGAPKDCDHGADENLEVEPQGPVLDVAVVEVRAVQHRGVPPQPLDSSQSSEPHRDTVAVSVARHLATELLYEKWPLGPWPDQAHVTCEHVEELRHLVE